MLKGIGQGVTQIFNLPYRRLAVGGPRDWAMHIGTCGLSRLHGSQITNLRYGRLQVCATGPASDSIDKFDHAGMRGRLTPTAASIKRFETLLVAV